MADRDPSEPSDAELWERLEREGEAGLAAIYDRYAGLVYGLGVRILRQPQEAEDLAQEIFLTLLKRRPYDPARGSLAAFLSTLTRSRAIDRLRRRARQSRLLEDLERSEPPPEDRISPEARTYTVESSRQVARAMDALPERQRRVLELAYFRGLSQTEIAAALDTPLGTVKSSARSALMSLRDSLGHLLE